MLRGEAFDQAAILDCLGHDGFAPCALAGTEYVEIGLDAVGARQRGQQTEPARLLGVGLAALHQGGCQRGPFLRCKRRAGKELVFDAVAALVRLDAEPARQFGNRGVNVPRAHDPAGQRVTLADRVADDVAEGLIGGRRHRHGERPAKRAVGGARAVKQDLERQSFQKLRLLGLVEHGKAGGDVGLERKLVQELGAEGMDRLHLQSAGRLQRAGKKPARQRTPRGIGRHMRPRLDRVIERGVVQRGPFGERVEDAFRHIGGGGLGEGDAEDFLGRHAAEQQPDHPLHQHMGLAGAGIGGDPRRNGRIGDFALQPKHVGRNDARRSHRRCTMMSSVTPPLLDHSLTRARWS